MESIRRKKPELVLNFSGKKANLLNRVRRILNPVTVKHPKLERGLMSVIFVFAVSGMILFSNFANSKNKVQLDLVNVKQLSSNGLDNEDVQNSKIILPMAAAVATDSIKTPLYILNGIEISKNVFNKLDKDEFESVFVLKDAKSKRIYGDKGKHGVVLIKTKETKTGKQHVSIKGHSKNAPMIFIDGLELSTDKSIDDIDPDEIESINVLKAKSATEKYDVEAANGVILITTKSDNKTLQKSKRTDEVVVIDYQSNDKPTVKMSSKGDTKNPPLYIIDGVEMNKQDADKLDPDEIESINVLKDKLATEKYGVEAANGVILITSKKKVEQKKQSKKGKSIKIKGKTKNPPLYIVNGVELKGEKTMNDIDPNDIESINVLKGEEAIDKYGKKAKNGVIEITTKGNMKDPSFNDYMKKQ